MPNQARVERQNETGAIEQWMNEDAAEYAAHAIEFFVCQSSHGFRTDLGFAELVVECDAQFKQEFPVVIPCNMRFRNSAFLRTNPEDTGKSKRELVEF